MPYKILKLTFASLILAFSSLQASIEMDADGWTRIIPSPDSRIVYVSSSEGNDLNDGLSPETPKATITGGDSLIRNGYPDHLLLKRGDTFPLGSRGLTRWKSGRNAEEPIVLSSYGNSGPRPVIELTGSFINHDGDVRNYIALIGLDLYRPECDPDSDRFANVSCISSLRLVGGGWNILLEDNRFRFMMTTIQSIDDRQTNSRKVYRDFVMRRNIIHGAWNHGSDAGDARIQGIFVSGVNGYIIEENVFDQNGWHPDVIDAEANQFNHNIYIQYSCEAGGIIRGNILTRAAAHAIQVRSGGVVDRNLIVRNSIGFNFGGDDQNDDDHYNFPNSIHDNVLLEGKRMDPNDLAWPKTAAVFGFGVAHYPATVEDNIVANRYESGTNRAIMLDDPSLVVSDIGNIVYKWNSDEDMFDASWLDPDRSVGGYNATLGGSNSLEAYVARLMERGPGEMPWELTAYSTINYIREGFNKPTVGGFYSYAGLTAEPVTGLSLRIGKTVVPAGTVTNLVADVQPKNASNQHVEWTSSNPEVATVSRFGLVVGLKEGNTTITAETDDGGYIQTVDMEVTGTVPVEKVTIIPLILSIKSGESYQTTPAIHPEHASDKSVYWKSSNEAVAVVSENGLVTGLSEGSAIITATSNDGGFSDTMPVTVAGTISLGWAGFDMDSSGNVDTGSLLGWIAVRGDWVWVWAINKYVYLPESIVSDFGAWTFFPAD